MDPISADSHVMEAEDVFLGLPERFGDDAPRVIKEWVKAGGKFESAEQVHMKHR